jgi:hypothetical protein
MAALYLVGGLSNLVNGFVMPLAIPYTVPVEWGAVSGDLPILVNGSVPKEQLTGESPSPSTPVPIAPFPDEDGIGVNGRRGFGSFLCHLTGAIQRPGVLKTNPHRGQELVGVAAAEDRKDGRNPASTRAKADCYWFKGGLGRQPSGESSPSDAMIPGCTPVRPGVAADMPYKTARRVKAHSAPPLVEPRGRSLLPFGIALRDNAGAPAGLSGAGPGRPRDPAGGAALPRMQRDPQSTCGGALNYTYVEAGGPGGGRMQRDFGTEFCAEGEPVPILDYFGAAFETILDVLLVVWVVRKLRWSPLVVLSIFYNVGLAVAVCPGCAGNAPSCTYSTNGKCPSIDVPTANAALVAGISTATTTAIALTGVIAPRFLRMFSRAHLQAVLQLVRRPTPGTIFEIKKDTKLSAILQAVGNGVVTMEQATIALATFIDDETETAVRAKLEKTYELLVATKELKVNGVGVGAVASDAGVFSWLWGKITGFVSEKGMQVHLDTGASSSTSSASVLTTTITRVKESTQFFECLNLFIMYTVALGLCTGVAVTEFLESAVFDTIRMRGYPWQVAAELLVVMLRRIEDSGGALTMANVTSDSHMNTLLDEALTSTLHHYPKIEFFRIRGANPQQRGGADSRVGDDRPGAEYNGRGTPSGTPCFFWNAGRPHPANLLTGNGTCIRAHVCDKWVSDQGIRGVCKGKAGTPGHTRDKCDNPKRCDQPVVA